MKNSKLCSVPLITCFTLLALTNTYAISLEKNTPSHWIIQHEIKRDLSPSLRIISLLTLLTLNLAPGATGNLVLGTSVTSTAYPKTYSVVVKGVSAVDATNVTSVTASLQVQ